MIKKKYYLTGLTGLCVAIVFAITMFTSFSKGFSGKYMVTAHRGDSARALENTLPAIEKAIESGADCIEIDVRRTKDLELVLLHDASLERTTGLKGNIWDYEYHQIQHLDAGSWFDDAFSGTPIPTLRQALEICQGKIIVNIEIKDGNNNEGIEKQTIELIQAYGIAEQCVITSKNYDYLATSKRLNADIKIGIILDEYIGTLDYELVDFYSINFANLTGSIVESLHNKGKDVHTWTIDRMVDIYAAEDMNVDNIVSNDPQLAVSYHYAIRE